MNRVRVWVCYEIVGDEPRKKIESLKALLEADPPRRRVVDGGGFVILKPAGVTVDFSSAEEVDPAQMGIDLEANVSMCSHGIPFEECEPCKLAANKESANADNP